MNKSYDYIVIGAGSAGCVLANRLSADPSVSVLLLEAGGPDRNPLFRLPMLMGRLFQSGIYNWQYHTEPEPNLNGRSIYWPRGKVLGGTSTINGMLYVRGNRGDYDGWAQRGLPGWSYDDVLPAFRDGESHIQRNDAFHGTDGELTVCRARGSNPLHEAFIRAGEEAGHPFNDDFNGETQEGFGRYDFTIRDGKRCSTSRAYLDPVSARPNLTILTHALTRRILIENGRATGVEIAHKGRPLTVRADREIILSAGTVNSPQILMLSGIGPADDLQALGIEPVVNLPGVGQNMQDHVDCVMAWSITKPISLYRDLRIDRLAVSLFKGMAFGTGFVTTFPYESGAFLRSHEGLEYPDIQLHFMPALESSANLHIPNPFNRRKTDDLHGFTLRIGPVNPDSRGQIRLRSADPADAPRIHCNYLDTEFDRRTMIDGIRMTRDIVSQKALDPYRGREIQPGPQAATDDELLAWLRASALTTFHPVGTCKMGTDDMAVTDARLKVRGIDGLRVADASIMPRITSGNTNAPAIMIGEQCARFILEQTGTAP